MSVRSTVEAYRAGSFDLDELARRLGERTYRPATMDIHPDRPPAKSEELAAWLADSSWPVLPETWREVDLLLSTPELLAVARAHEDWAHARAKAREKAERTALRAAWRANPKPATVLTADQEKIRKEARRQLDELAKRQIPHLRRALYKEPNADGREPS